MWRDDSILQTSRNPELPANWTRAFNNCNKQYQLRNWTTILWTDESICSFIKNHYPSFLPTYNSYPYSIQRVDAARYFILFHYGGVYLDLDVGCLQNKDLTDLLHSMEHLEKTVLMPQTQPIGFSNDVLIATKGSLFFKRLVDALPSKNKWYGSPYLTVLYSTGPMFLTLQYKRLPSARQKDILILPPKLYVERGTQYVKHLRGSTWHQQDAQIVQWMARNWSVVSGVLLLAVVMCCSRTRRTPQKRDCKKV